MCVGGGVIRQTGPEDEPGWMLGDGAVVVWFSVVQSPDGVSAVRRSVCFSSTGVSSDARFWCLTSQTAVRMER